MVFNAGFGPFFLLAGLWSAISIPVWLCAYATEVVLPSALPPMVWHAHEMVFGFAFASVAGRNWRNLPMAAGLSLVATGSLLVHLHALAISYTAEIGNHLGIATPCMLIALVGARTARRRKMMLST